MSEAPPIRYTRTHDGFHVGYQVHGGGEVDIVFLPEWGAALEGLWEHPAHLRFNRFLGSLGRVIVLDYRGFGCSDPVAKERLGRIDDWVTDVLAVMDAVGSTKAVISAEVYSGHAAVQFAVSHPERTLRLALVNCFATFMPEMAFEGIDQLAGWIEQNYGTGAVIAATAPALASDPAFLPFCARLERLGASPATAETMVRAEWGKDVSDLLPQVSVPTLVTYTGDYTYASLDQSRHLAAQIPGAIFVEATGHSFYAPDQAERWDDWAAFIVGGPKRVSIHRKLSTVLFTDVVDSSVHASSMGDERWATLLENFDDYVTGIIEHHAGQVVKQTGDGVLATFETPADAARAGTAIARGVHVLGVEVRVGVHAGEVEIRPNGDGGGIAVHAAARIMATAKTRQVLASRTVAELAAGSGIEFTDQGGHELKGVPGTWQLYEVVS